MNQHVAQPYPEIHVEEENPAYARMMLGNIGGRESELTAAGQYFYNRLLTTEYAEISQAFHRICIDEMRHLEIFGGIVLALGADPGLWELKGSKKSYWSPRYCRYRKKPRQILSNALFCEYITIEKYTAQIKAIKDEGIISCLNRIIEDEREHVRVFKELLLRV